MSGSARILGCALVLVLIGAGSPSIAQEPAGLEARPSVRQRLEAIRDDLVELRLEQALSALAALLGEPGMTDAERGEALVLRAQVHVAFGDLDAAEHDYREILGTRPGYVPEASLTPRKAMDRFKKVQAELVGWLRVDLDPPDARLFIDGSAMIADSEGRIALLSGEHRLHAESPGHDALDQTVQVQATKDTSLRVQLTPNARTVIVTTDQADVAVLLDGAAVGRTEHPQSPSGQRLSVQTAELTLENLALGEHIFELRKSCFRTERLEEILTVDLLDRGPKRYPTVYMVPVRSTLTVQGGPDGAEITVDGELIGRLPLDPFEVCPGPREIAASFGKRVIWKSVELLPESTEVSIAIEARPNAVLLGAEKWPAALDRFASAFNATLNYPLPSGQDLSTPEGWTAVELREDTDLALAIVPPSRIGTRDRWYLYSPILQTVQSLDVAPAKTTRPSWTSVVWGLSTADSEIGGSALVVELTPGGPAVRAGLVVGDRIKALGGASVDGSAQVRERLAAAAAEGRIPVQWSSPDGEVKQAEIVGATTPLLASSELSVEQATVRAAWAVLDSICSPDRRYTALANLALLFSDFGHHALAAETWRRVGWGERAGIGAGTSQYYLGRELERLGKESDAVEAYRKAALSAASAFTDEGPGIGPAAADRLADLGVTVEPTAR